MWKVFRKIVSVWLILALLLFSVPVTALANPEGGIVALGNANISSSGTKLDIHQTSDKAIIDWRSFDINSNEHTEFHLPSSSSFTLNRISQNSPSQINGKLSANGNIILMNPNGIMFGAGSQVDVNGLIATTADIKNEDFNAGKMNFGIAGSKDAKIINNGAITAKQAGLVGLVAPHVENNGTITAKLGKVSLAAGDKFTLDMAGDDLIKVDVTDQVKNLGITNTGKLIAEGGVVELTAADARSLVSSLITNTGGIDVSNKSIGGKGGKVQILAQNIELNAGTKIDASGHSGGCKINIGGDKQGKGNLQQAKNVYVDKDAVINNDATHKGNGGETIVWSNGTTKYYGFASARGGAAGGNGGFIETSGHSLFAKGSVSTLAPNGKVGTYLLDPTDITIYSRSSGQTPDGDSVFTTDYLESLASSSSLTLTADNNIIFDFNGYGDVLNSSYDLTFTSGYSIYDSYSGGGISLTINAPNINFNSGSGGINLYSTNFGSSLLNATTNSGGAINIDTTSTLNLGNISAGSIHLAADGAVTLSGAITTGSGNVIIESGGTFYNNGGSLQAGEGSRWLVYLSAPTDDNYLYTNAGLNSDFFRYSSTYGCGGCPSLGSGNGFLYAQTPSYHYSFDIGGSATYGDSDANLGYNLYGNAGNGDTVDLSNMSLTSDYSQGLGVGSFNVYISGVTLLSTLGYAIDFTNSHGTVYKKTVTASGNSQYGNSMSGISYSGFVLDENESILDSISAPSINDSTTPGNYSITGSDDNYEISGNYSVTKRLLTLSGALTGTYGTAIDSSALSWGNFVGSDDYSGLDSVSNFTPTAAGLGQAATITITDDLYDFDSTGLFADIGKATLYASLGSGTYGGNHSNKIVYTGFVNGEDASVIDSLATVTGTSLDSYSNAGDYYFSFDNAGSDNNYEISTTDGNYTIYKASLNATLGSGRYGSSHDNKVVYSGFVNGDTASVIDTNATVSGPDLSSSTAMGDYYFTFNSAGSDNNYEISTTDGNYTIGKGLLTLSLNNYQYGDSIDAGSVNWSGFVNGDDYSFLDSVIINANTASLGSKTASVGSFSDDLYDIDLANSSLNYTVGKRTITANISSGTYGANHSSKIIYDGFVFGDSSIDVLPTLSGPSLDSYSNAGSYYYTFNSAGSDDKYQISTYDGNYTINKAILTISGTGSYQYGDTFGAAVNWSGFGNGENISAIDSLSLSGSTSSIGSFTASLDNFSDNNYEFDYGNSNLDYTVNKKTLTANLGSGTYGDSHANKIVYTGFAFGQDSSVLDSGATVIGDTAIDSSSSVGDYAFTFDSLGSDDNYEIIGTNGNYTINKAMLTVTADAQNITYGDDLPINYTGSITGFVNGEDSSILGTTPTFDASGVNLAGLTNAGTYTIAGSGGIAANYNFSYVDSVLTVAKKTLTVTAENKSKTYGDANPTLTLGYSGFVAEEDQSVIDTAATGATAATQYSDVGTYAITGSGALDNNYSFNYVDGTLTIDQKAITASLIGGISKTYNGNNTATLGSGNFSLSGLVNSDAVTISNTSGTFDDKNVGSSKNVTVGSLALSGAKAGNYSISGDATGAIGAITAKALSISGITADNKIYDGTTTATLSGSGTLVGKITGDVLSLNNSSAAASFADKNVASGKTVTASGFALSGSDSSNYTLSQPSSITANITAKSLSAALTGGVSKIYDKTTSATLSNSNYTLSGVIGDENVSLTGTGSGSFVDENVGSSKTISVSSLGISGADAGNYSLASGSISGAIGAIIAKALTITADAKSKTYASSDLSLSYTSSGLVGDDSITGSLTRASGENAGVYAISQGTLDAGSNYNTSYTGANFTINKAALTLAVNNASKTKGQANPNFAYTLSGLLNADTSSVISGVSYSTPADLNSNAGTYSIAAFGGNASNYDLTYIDGVLTVNPEATPPAPQIPTTINREVILENITTNLAKAFVVPSIQIGVVNTPSYAPLSPAPIAAPAPAVSGFSQSVTSTSFSQAPIINSLFNAGVTIESDVVKSFDSNSSDQQEL